MADARVLHKFLRDEFEAEARGGFARLRRVPDTHVRHFLDYYASLNGTDQDALADASTLAGAVALARDAASPTHETLKSNPAWKHWLHEMAMGTGRDPHFYYGVPLLRACAAQAKIDRSKGHPASVSKELEEYALSIRSVKAPELRKHVRSTLQTLMGARPVKLGGGGWEYEGIIEDSNVKVRIDYGGASDQLRYHVSVQPKAGGFALEWTGFELALGVGHGNWDFIVEENVSDSMALLREFVTYVVELPRRTSLVP